MMWCECSGHNLPQPVSSLEVELEGCIDILADEAWKSFNIAKLVWDNLVWGKEIGFHLRCHLQCIDGVAWMTGLEEIKKAHPCSTETCVVIDCQSLSWTWKGNVMMSKARICCPSCLPVHRSTREMQDADSWDWLRRPKNLCCATCPSGSHTYQCLFPTRFTKLRKYTFTPHHYSAVLCLNLYYIHTRPIEAL